MAGAHSMPIDIHFLCKQLVDSSAYPALNSIGCSSFSAGWPVQQADSKDPAQHKWPPALAQPPEGSSYCDVGHTHVLGRQFSEAHMRACLHAGISITGGELRGAASLRRAAARDAHCTWQVEDDPVDVMLAPRLVWIFDCCCCMSLLITSAILWLS